MGKLVIVNWLFTLSLVNLLWLLIICTGHFEPKIIEVREGVETFENFKNNQIVRIALTTFQTDCQLKLCLFFVFWDPDVQIRKLGLRPQTI